MSNEQVARQLICEHCGAPLTQPNLPAETRAILAELDNESDPTRIVMCDHCGYRNTLPPLPDPPPKPISKTTQQEPPQATDDEDNEDGNDGHASSSQRRPQPIMGGFAVGLIIMLITAGGFMAVAVPFFFPSAVIGINPNSVSFIVAPPSCAAPLMAPISFTFMNPYSGVGWSGQATILDPANNYVAYESTVQVNTMWKTNQAFLSGSSWQMVLRDNYTFSEFQFTVPCENNLQLSQHGIMVYVVPAPNLKNIALNVRDANGAVILRGYVWNTTAKGITSPIFNIQFVNKQDGTGWPGSSGTTNPATLNRASAFYDKRTFDTVLNAYRTLDVALVVKITGQSASTLFIRNLPKIYLLPPATYYYGSTLTEYSATGAMMLDRYKLPNGNYDPYKSGTYSTSIPFDATTLVGNATVTVTLYFYADLRYLAAYGAMNSEAVAMQTFTFTITK